MQRDPKGEPKTQWWTEAKCQMPDAKEGQDERRVMMEKEDERYERKWCNAKKMM